MVMENYKVAEKLIKDADKYLKEAERNYKDKESNITIRRAQEAVELYLKGFLKLLCVEFPKIHDIGVFFIKILEEKKIEIKEEEKNLIIEASSFLAEKRATAFYREIEYDKKMLKKL